jgi:uncharacterized membrane protein YqjE
MQSGQQMARHNEGNNTQESLPELLGRLATESASLVRDEISLAEQELKEKASAVRPGIMLVSSGAVVGAIALMTLCAAAVIGLGELIGYGLAALIIAVFLAIASGVVLSIGIARLKQVDLKPEQTIETLKEGLTNG